MIEAVRINMRKFEWVDIKKMLFKFTIMFMISAIIILGFNYFFGGSKIDFASAFYLALGVSFGMTFADLFKKKGIK